MHVCVNFKKIPIINPKVIIANGNVFARDPRKKPVAQIDVPTATIPR